MVEPHAVVYAELRPAVAQGARGEVRARYHEGQDDAGPSLFVLAVAHCAWGWAVPSRLLRDTAWIGRLVARLVAAVLGAGRTDGLRSARNVDGQFGHAHVGLAAIRHDRRQPQLMVGWLLGVW